VRGTTSPPYWLDPKTCFMLTTVGMVGAGGIGVILWDIMRAFQYAETCAVMIIIVVTVTVIDVISARIRKSLI
jgi:phosphonate transport system permease protein